MSERAYGSTVAKRRLAAMLTQLREASGFTANQVCDQLSWGRGKVGRFEANQWKRPEMSDVRDLLRLYGVDDERRRELEELAVLARLRPWWRDFGDVFGTGNEFPGYEMDASRISVYIPLVLPGLVQTQPYMDAQMRIGMQPGPWQARASDVRRRRQQILDREDGTAPLLRVSITEASLMYRWGTAEARHEQIMHLVDLGQRPNVELRLLRFADGLHPGGLTAVNIFEFPNEQDPNLVFLEGEYSLMEMHDADEAAAYCEIFERICAAALKPSATTDFLEHLAENQQ
jgi:transcriptional regulator with XRE-family HTH domain